MSIKEFTDNYREAFGEKAELPVVFWYSETPAAVPEKVAGCMFKLFPKLRGGTTITFSAETLTCGGGKFYCGLAPMPERVPNFVSLTEKYKSTPAMVRDFLDRTGVPASDKPYLNFARLDDVTGFDDKEGLTFFATPDMLSGLATWAYFDNNDDGAVSSIFGSGCCSTVTQAVIENNSNGRRTFIGGFDPSVRPYLEPDILTFTIPMVRFREMYATLRRSCLFDTHAWKKVKERIG